MADDDPDYEIDSDGHWTPRQRTDWTKEEMAAADAAYQKTMQGLEPCTKCQGRKIYCYKCDDYKCQICDHCKHSTAGSQHNNDRTDTYRTQLEQRVTTPERSRSTRAKTTSQGHNSDQSGTIDAQSITKLQQCNECKQILPELEGDLARRLGDYSTIWPCWQCKLSNWSNYVQHE